MGLNGFSGKVIFLCSITALLTFSAGLAEESSAARNHDGKLSNNGSSPAPLKLYGRIDELSNGSGARLPAKLEPLTPKRDPSLDAKNANLTGNASRSFPVDYLGTWSGELTVVSFDYDKAFFNFDRSEAKKQAQLLKAGTIGSCSVRFLRGKDNETEMRPCAVVFASNANANAASVQNIHSSAFTESEIPFVYYLHFGDLGAGKGVTGNEISCQLMRNTLKELAKGVMEQEVVTRDSDRNPKSRKVKTGFTESVLRFTRLNSNRLYTQAASVSYGSDAKFQNKVILYGTLTRTGN